MFLFELLVVVSLRMLTFLVPLILVLPLVASRFLSKLPTDKKSLGWLLHLKDLISNRVAELKGTKPIPAAEVTE